MRPAPSSTPVVFLGILIAAALTLAGALAGAVRSAAVPASSSAAAETTPLSWRYSGTWRMAVRSVERPGKTIDAATAVGTFLIIKLLVANGGASSQALLASDFALQTADGHSYPVAAWCCLFYATEHQLQDLGQLLPPDTPALIPLIFDVGPYQQGLQLIYTNPATGRAVRWDVPPATASPR